jgi:hypothetical protein
MSPNTTANLALVALGLIAAFFILRPELWGRLLFERIDPRPAGLLRIAFGLATVWTLLDLWPYARIIFTDEGLWLPSAARVRFSGQLAYLWDPEHGFERWGSLLQALRGPASILHIRSDPPLVFALYWGAVAALVLMTLGVWTRLTTLSAWLLLGQLYRYDTIFYNGGDFVVQVFLFLGLFCEWGEAYSIDSWRRARRRILDGATAMPATRRIPAWPQRLMMLQLAIVYCATGLAKEGETWRNGTALYYALNLDHFYRVPLQGAVTWLQYLGVLPLLTWITRWWEVLFPLALLGALLRGYERAREARELGRVGLARRWASWACGAAAWVVAASLLGPALADQLEGSGPVLTSCVIALPLVVVFAYRLLRERSPRGHHILLHWVLGKRVWLVFGLLLHGGIDLAVNIGTFSELMMVTYLAWLSGEEIERLRRTVLTRVQGAPIVVLYRRDEAGIRRAALLRRWDTVGRLVFVADESVDPAELHLERDGRAVTGAAAVRELARACPGLWWLLPLSVVPGARNIAGRIGLGLVR